MSNRIDFDLQPPLPAIDLKSVDWNLQESCNFSSQIFNSIYYAATMTLVRHLGHERTYEIHAQMLRHHQTHFFLSGLRKLGLHLERSDAIRCAKYHCISNAIGGVRTGYAIENDNKAWLFYFPHTPDNAWPGQASVAHSRGNMLSDYLGWHANNGNLLGNKGLRYVATHFVCDGDPFDGGYFEDTGRELETHELVIQRLGEEPPIQLPIEKANLDPQEWPLERSAKALRNYAVTWAADRIWSLINTCGAQGDDFAQRAIQSTLFSWMPRFLAATGDFGDEARNLASYIALFHSLTGARIKMDGDAEAWTVQIDRPLHTFVGGEQTDEEKQRFGEVLERAWGSVGKRLGCSVVVSEDGTIWRVTPWTTGSSD